MEIKINKEIREYNETMFFGLSVRQFICALLACGAAVGIYFGCRPYFGTEHCHAVYAGAVPFCGTRLYYYHGMTAKLLRAVVFALKYRWPTHLLSEERNISKERTQTMSIFGQKKRL